MKQTILILTTFFFFNIGVGQNRYSTVTPSRYEPMSFDELSVVAMSLQKRYDANQKYLYEMKKWILELKPQIKEQSYLTRLDKEYKDLTDIEDGDLARATKYLKQTENAIREIISDYNIWVSNQNNNNSTSRNSGQTNDSSGNYAQIGMQHLQNREYALAVRNFSKYLETDKNNTDVIFFRAMAKGELGDRFGAISDYDKVIELNSNYPMQYNKVAMAYNNKAYSYVKLKEYEKALPIVEKALELDESEWYFWDTRGEIYLNLGKYKQSISDLNKALKIEKNPNSYLLRGLALIKSGEKENGCKDLSKAGEMGSEEAYTEIEKNCN
ncbi:tetratricopeptide repeat protein [Confluentibacter lentus]|uniref:tetratricopeptide repeat protein n=1 Tax=Confluentibacter lentus TaxID=1699412 RepID=UPI000C284CB6|nr:tetratricopeptide repeat protein [Confluentibacter lentus]